MAAVATTQGSDEGLLGLGIRCIARIAFRPNAYRRSSLRRYRVGEGVVRVSTSGIGRRGVLFGAVGLLVLAATVGGILNPWRAHAAAIPTATINGDVYV